MACVGPIGEPVPCDGWTVYDSYVTDPQYADYFTYGWTSALALAFLIAAPSIVAYGTSGRWREGGLVGKLGVYEDTKGGGYSSLSPADDRRVVDPPAKAVPRPARKVLLYVQALVASVTLRTLAVPRWMDPSRLPFLSRLSSSSASCHPSNPRLPFSIGSLVTVGGLVALVLCTLLPESQLAENPNRFGFLALASLPPLFLLSAKSGPVMWLTGKGWTGVNFLHRWMGRIVVLLVLLHFYFWTVQWVASSQVSTFLSGDKEVRGLYALGFLLLIGLSSARPLRRYSYPVFFTLHYVGIIGFLVYVNSHTIYAQGWATWGIGAIYMVDIAGRLSGMRLRYVEVEALEGGMVRVGMKGLSGGWRGGQHLSMRLFFAPTSRSIFSAFRPIEAHPFSISSAPPTVSVLPPRGIELFIKACAPGSWTADLFDTATIAQRIASSRSTDGKAPVLHMLALIEGPYGGLGYNALEEENVLLVAGGSGMSHVLGVLDETVGGKAKSGKGGRIQVVWAVRDRAQITAFQGPLQALLHASDDIPNLTLTLLIHLTCDPSLTSSSPSSPTSPTISLIHTQTILSRPLLSSILSEVMEEALIPCRACYPVCRCGEFSADGMCGNDEEECCTGPGDARELMETDEEDEKDEKKEKSSLSDVAVLVGSKRSGSCCSPAGREEEEIQVVPVASCCSTKDLGVEVKKSGGCCASTGKGCCSGKVEGKAEEHPDGPLRYRTGGLGVVVCGPAGMIAEMRNTVATVPLAKRVRIGGINFHEEHFSL